VAVPVEQEPVSARTVLRWAVAAALGFLLVYLAASAVLALRNILVLVLISLFIAVSLDPAVRWLTRHGVRRAFAVTIIFALAFALVAFLIAQTGPPLVREAVELSKNFPGYIENLNERSRAFRSLSDRYGLTEQIINVASTLPGKIGSGVLGFIGEFFGALFTALLVIVLSIYFMADLPRLRRGVTRLFPAPSRPRARRVVDVVVDKVGAYMIGNLLISLVAGVSTFVVLTVLKVPFALPLALAVAIFDLFPMIGATLGAVVTVLVTWMTTDLWPTTVIVAIFFIVYQQLENYLIAPRILRNTVDLPALAVLLAGLAGGAMLGLIGALMAIPIAAVVKVLATPMLEEFDEAEAAVVPDDGAAPPGAGAAPPGPVPPGPAPSGGADTVGA
jgi:predicted PurR-regulated permease PerM